MSLTPNQYTTIIRIFDKRRSEALRIQAEHLAEVREQIPEYAQLEDDAAHLAVAYGIRLLDEPDLTLEDMDSQLEALSICKESLLRAHGYSPDYVLPSFTCPDCQDTGYIDNKKCHCFKQLEIELLYRQSNIRDFLEKENFSKLRDDLQTGDDSEHFKAAVNASHKFIDSFDTEYSNLLLYGTVGTGKSFLSACIAKELLESGHSVIYFSATDLFDTIASNTFNRGNIELSDIENNDLYECDLLVIDDLGTELTNSFVCSSLFTCLNARHLRRKSTIVSTNLSLSELHERYSDRIFSRAMGNYILLKLTGKDVRMMDL